MMDDDDGCCWSDASSPFIALAARVLRRQFIELASHSRDMSGLSAEECEALFAVGRVVPFSAGDELMSAGQEVSRSAPECS